MASAAAAAIMAVAGCESFGPNEAPANAEASAVRQASPNSAEDALLFGAIKDPRLPSGACGMVLWTLDEQSPKPVFKYVSGETAEAFVSGDLTKFTLVDASGGARFGVPARQSFVSADGKRADVRVAFGLGFDGGVYVERAVITMEDSSGWRTVTPAAGLAGCRG
ncbi:MAG: hypothetical protein AAFX08_06895 [Pseudomonadota bacterium]